MTSWGQLMSLEAFDLRKVVALWQPLAARHPSRIPLGRRAGLRKGTGFFRLMGADTTRSGHSSTEPHARQQVVF
jgi:hypothetical protein